MTQPTDPLDNAPGEDAMAILTECRAKILEREGIPMFIAVDDMRPGRTLTVEDDRARVQGRQLADLFTRYDRQLEALDYPDNPARDEPDHTGARELIDSLVVLSDQHLRPKEDLR